MTILRPGLVGGASDALAGTAGVVVTVVLLVTLVVKELASAVDSPRAVGLGRALNVVILPLLLAFALVVVARLSSMG